MTYRPFRCRPSYRPPRKDSQRARAQAALFLTGARSIDHLTIETFASQYRLSTATAATMLQAEQARRGRL
jgi:hypothetical protein